jgi:hypothetical protein
MLLVFLDIYVIKLFSYGLKDHTNYEKNPREKTIKVTIGKAWNLLL